MKESEFRIDLDELRKLADKQEWMVEKEFLLATAKELEGLRAKIEAMEKQEPVAWQRLYKDGSGTEDVTDLPYVFEHQRPLYALPGAQPAPSMPDGWLRAINEALVVAHIGVANASDTYEQAKAKLDSLIGFHVDVATDPAANGGYKLVPIEPTITMRQAGDRIDLGDDDTGPYDLAWAELEVIQAVICYHDQSWCADAPHCSNMDCRSRITDKQLAHADELELPLAWVSKKDGCGKYQEKKE